MRFCDEGSVRFCDEGSVMKAWFCDEGSVRFCPASPGSVAVPPCRCALSHPAADPRPPEYSSCLAAHRGTHTHTHPGHTHPVHTQWCSLTLSSVFLSCSSLTLAIVWALGEGE